MKKLKKVSNPFCKTPLHRESKVVVWAVGPFAATQGLVHPKDTPRCEMPLSVQKPRGSVAGRPSILSSGGFLTSRVKTAEGVETSAPDVCTLHTKSESGEQTYIVKMLFTETTGDLQQHLSHAR